MRILCSGRRWRHAKNVVHAAREISQRARVIIFIRMALSRCPSEVRKGKALSANFTIKLGQTVGEFSAAHAKGQARNLDVTLADEFIEGVLNDGVQEHRSTMFIKQHELRIDARLNGKLAQQSRAKTVNRRDDRAIQRAFVPQPTPPI